MQESGQTDFAIAYLTALEKGENNQALKKSFRLRINAFHEVRRIERARDTYRKSSGSLPETVEQLVRGGFIAPVPVDPYGGAFYFEPDGKVATTSKFAFGGVKKENVQKAGEAQ